MAKKRKETNYRLVVYPDSWRKDDSYACEELKKDIERHVDGFSNIEINSDTIHYCEFCKTEWSDEEMNDGDVGACCKRDAESVEELHRLAQKKAEKK